VGRGRKLKDGSDTAVLSIGPLGVAAQEAIRQAEAEQPGLSVAHYDMRFLKPLDERLLTEVAARFKRIVTLEDGVRTGGLGSAVLEWLSDHGMNIPVTRLGLPDHFVEHGTVEELRRIVGIDKESIKNAISQQLTAKNEEI
jgi:1-deoxy-D-xylulose-5-phosphate synthase